MTDTATTAAAATPTGTQRKATGGHVEANPAKAGWGTKAFLIIICVLWMVPIFGTLVTSFRTYDDANRSGWWTVFSDPSTLGDLTLNNYTRAIEDSNMGNAFINSLAI